jgi:single-strand DNA-binding protein
MARSVNQVTLLGNVGNDPEIRRFGERAVANFSLATSESWKDKRTGEWQESTQWHRVTAWSPLAEIVEKWLKKGSKVYLQGKVKYEQWEKDGKMQYATKIEAREIVLLDAKQERSEPAPLHTAEQLRDPEHFKDLPTQLADKDDLPF